ncbi:putative reverse transcriptase domain-containing protein [Tanacetum coccineum]
MTITRSGMTPEAIEELVNRRVEEALAAHEATRAANALEAENQSQNGSDGGNGNGGNGNGRNENPNENGRGDRPVARECTYQDFMKCQPLNLGRKGLFQELTMMCTKMVPEEEDRVEKFIGGLPDNIQGNVIAVEPTRLQDAVRIANNLMDQNLKGYVNIARAYMAGNNKMNGYEGTLPFCNKCKLHHEGQCTAKCRNYKRIGHITRDCRFVMTVPTQGTPGPNQGVITFLDARGKAYVLGGGDANPGSNTVTGTFLLNDHHAYMLFDSGADRSFVSNTFSALLDITPYALDVSYAVELADGRTSETNTVLRGCTLGLLGHPFNIDLMPIDLGSFDVIIGMDWLAKNHAVIVCDEKIVRIPYGNKILIVQGDKSDKEKKSTLSIISCVKAQKYIEKGCQLFLAQVMVKETEDKSKEKRY